MTYEDKKGRFITRSGWLVMSYILVVVGVAAITWAAAVNDWMGIGRERRAEQRSLQSVGLSSLPTAPIGFLIHPSSCLANSSGWVDGRDASFYVTNRCNHQLDLPNYAYRVKAHDGTVIESGRWAFNGDKSIGVGERREQKLSIEPQDRAEMIEVWVFD